MTRRHPQTRIFTQLLLFVLPFMILGIAATSAVLMWTNYNYFHKTVDQNYSNIIRTSASEIDQFMTNAVTDMESLAWILRVARLDDWHTEMALSAFQFSKPKFERVALVTTDGRRIPASGDESLEDHESVAGVMQKAFAGDMTISAVAFGDNDLPLVHMAVPVQRLGKIEAILYAKLNLKYVWDVLAGISIGDTGHVFIIDPSGRYLAHREIDRVVKGIPAYGQDRLDAIKTSPLPIKWTEQSNWTRYFCLGAHLPNQDWIIVLRQAVPEIYTYLYTNLVWAATITALACLVAVLLGWVQVRTFIRPIETMHRQVQRIGQGDLDHQVSVTATNEIGELGAAFNEMTASLKTTVEREIQTATELAHARNLAILGESASKVTHEVGNLLNNVGMSANALHRETLSQNGQQALARMETESERVRGFIQEFLQFAKPPELRIVPVAVDLIIREVMATQEPAGGGREIDYGVDWPEKMPKVPVDTRLMYQVFTNLIKNSTEAIDGNGWVRVTGRVADGHMEIIVQDNGCGITAGDRERIFEPFFTTKGKAGNGLGMAIVQSIITAHRGSIACQSEEGKGTRMVIRLPL